MSSAGIRTIRHDSNLDGYRHVDFIPETAPVFENYALNSRNDAKALFLLMEESGQLIAICPVLIVEKALSLSLLHARMRNALNWIPRFLVERRAAVIDTFLMGYAPRSPFAIRAEYMPISEKIKAEFIDYVMTAFSPDSIWVAGDSLPGMPHQSMSLLPQFKILPLASVDISGCNTFSQYRASLSRKRRRNLDHATSIFKKGEGRIAVETLPSPQGLLLQAHKLLLKSAERSAHEAPYLQLCNSLEAFLSQDGLMVCAYQNNAMIAFMSFFATSDMLYQTHGGLDYSSSLDLKAYENILYYSISLALDKGLSKVCLGPLNNETKRRLSNCQSNVEASLWCRTRFDRWLANNLIIPNLSFSIPSR
ncbi:hypothetical protein [Synechococcus sp. CCY9202]|uniref:hypothetical protein n=1 Tax=Synechococcus sp. CCY9202 TaxID=174698 RepID=UPI002B2154A3|nr:hypothetical protein [Synechococcus sp. CCY9202]MEA5423922.1 hypothetical protein [Synechococcus sp. CCY9202]